MVIYASVQIVTTIGTFRVDTPASNLSEGNNSVYNASSEQPAMKRINIADRLSNRTRLCINPIQCLILKDRIMILWNLINKENDPCKDAIKIQTADKIPLLSCLPAFKWNVYKSKKEISTMQYFGSYRTSFNRYRKI